VRRVKYPPLLPFQLIFHPFPPSFPDFRPLRLNPTQMKLRALCPDCQHSSHLSMSMRRVLAPTTRKPAQYFGRFHSSRRPRSSTFAALSGLGRRARHSIARRSACGTVRPLARYWYICSMSTAVQPSLTCSQSFTYQLNVCALPID